MSQTSGAGEIPTRDATEQCVRACTIRLTGVRQSPGEGWRNRRMVGYQGESDRSSIQRQSAAKGRSTQTGRPSAPARCTPASCPP